MSGANTYSGGTSISSGTLKVGISSSGTIVSNLVTGITNGALGTNTAASSNIIASGATLDLNGYNLYNSLTLNGLGLGSNGALINSSVTVATQSGAITLITSYIGGIGDLIINGIVSESGTAVLTKVGSGILTLSGANTFSGGVILNSGTLKAGVSSVGSSSGAFGKSSGTVQQNSSGGVTIDLNGYTVANSLLLYSAASPSVYALTDTAGSGVASGSTITSSGTIMLGLAATKTMTVSNAIIGASTALKINNGTDTGTVILSSGSNTYYGLTTIASGTLKIGAAGGITSTPLGSSLGVGTIVNNGATLDLNGFTLGLAEALTLNGAGFSGAGALTNSSETAVNYSGLITLGSAATITASSGNIVISNVGTITGTAYNLTLNGTNTASRIASIITAYENLNELI